MYLTSLKYPFEQDISRLERIERIPNELLTSEIRQDMYPDIKSDTVSYHHAPKKQYWNDEIADLIIFSIEHKIKEIVLFFTEDIYRIINLENLDWKEIYKKPLDWDPVEKYNIGYTCGLTKGLEYTLTFLPPIFPYQMFISNKLSYDVPFKTNTAACNKIIKEKGLKIYAHSPYVFNLANEGLGEKIKTYLTYATDVGCQGVVFHVGCQTKKSLNDALKNMKDNILYAMEDNLCPIILEIGSGKGTQVLCNYKDFTKFAQEIYIERPNFGICIDTCHSFDNDYDPYQYLNHFYNLGIPIKLIHFNDSKFMWKSHKDRHAKMGDGYVPWLSLERVASLAQQLSIDCVIEY